MTVHLLSCGTSILRNRRALNPRDAGPIDLDVGTLIQWATGTLTDVAQAGQWAASLAEQLDDLDIAPKLREAQSRKLLSAEIAALDWDNHRPISTDRIVLLASDTAKGVLAALLVGVALDRPVRYHSSTPRHPGDEGFLAVADVANGAAAPVDVVRVEKLLPDSTVQFNEAMEHLGAAVVWARQLDLGAPLALHLAGGYKATIPYLVAFAEYLQARWRNITAWCLHEGDEELGTRPEPVRVGLRPVDVAADMAALRTAHSGRIPAGGRLERYCYDVPAGEPVLTPLGRGLSAFLPFMNDR